MLRGTLLPKQPNNLLALEGVKRILPKGQKLIQRDSKAIYTVLDHKHKSKLNFLIILGQLDESEKIKNTISLNFIELIIKLYEPGSPWSWSNT